MDAFIIEDEKPAQLRLIQLLSDTAPDINVVGTAKSVKNSLAWLKEQERMPDVIFMDVELEDGNCFEIFSKISITSNVVMVTAFNKYALKAFEVGCIDYLLKPISQSSLLRSVERCRANKNVVDASMLLSALGKVMFSDDSQAQQLGFRKRFIVRNGEEFVPVQLKDVLYFYSEDSVNYIVTQNHNQYVINLTLDVIADLLPPLDFFRINRYCIISVAVISSMTRLKGGRIKINTYFEPACEFVVSRSRVDDFLNFFS